MKIQIRKFNEKGLNIFKRFLEDAKNGDNKKFPVEYIKSPKWTDPLKSIAELELKTFDSKSDLVKYVYKHISEIEDFSYFDGKLWSWLSALYFDSICPVENGKRKVYDNARYILNAEHWGRYYRHLIAGPVKLYSELGEDAKLYLTGPVHKHGDLMEQLGSRQEIATCKGIIQAATELYWDSEKNIIKKGARDTDKGKPGTLRRFTSSIIPQFQLTYDLNAMNGGEILNLLPSEFDKWKS